MSKILSINNGIGSSAGWFIDGEAVFCMEEERLNRVKNWMGFPVLAVQYIFEHCIKDVAEIDLVTLCDKNTGTIDRVSFYKSYDDYLQTAMQNIRSPSKRFTNVLKQSPAGKRIDYYLKRISGTNNEKDEAKELLITKYKIPAEKIIRNDHHTCHAASAYYGLAPSTDDEYLVFTLDGGGDGIKSALFKAAKGKLENLQRSNHYSIGNIYSAITFLLGFTPHEHEYKLMGLAPYVNPKYTEKYKAYFSKFLSLKNEDTEFFNPRHLNHPAFIETIKRELLNDRFDNIAAGLQAFTEEIVCRWVKGNIKKYGINKVLASGGVFMNVKMNMLVAGLSEVNYFDVFPSCGDESNIFGSAYYTYNQQTEKKKTNLLKGYTLGIKAEEDIVEALEEYKGKINWKQDADINKYVAEQLTNNKIIARCTGAMEFGARALGNRSIMANPANLLNVNKINQAVKKRDFWMPFAPAMPADKMDLLVKIPASVQQQKSPYMMIAFPGIEDKMDSIICGIHQADHTARVESLDEKRYPDFYKIVDHFYKLTGTPCVLNTSFNLHGFPIVTTSKEAIDVLFNSKIDELIISNYIISKK